MDSAAVVFLDFAFPTLAQLGIKMTPAIARATDFKFRVMFIVFGRGLDPEENLGVCSRAAPHNHPERPRQDKHEPPGFPVNLRFAGEKQQSISCFLIFFLASSGSILVAL
jgi:hypothetical protein